MNNYGRIATKKVQIAKTAPATRSPTMIKCCEHNPCPDRPKWRLRRFRNQPWRCTQCGQFWVTTWQYADYVGSSYDWIKVEP